MPNHIHDVPMMIDTKQQIKGYIKSAALTSQSPQSHRRDTWRWYTPIWFAIVCIVRLVWFGELRRKQGWAV